MNEMDGRITGLTFFDIPEIWDKLQVGTMLTLKRDIDNIYDANAVQVLYNRKQIGWVEKTDNIELAPILDQGIIITTRITRIYGTSTSTPHLEVQYTWDE